MTDAELIAALGWQPCDDKGTKFCQVHYRVMGGDTCELMDDRLDGVEAGIDLARNGITAVLADCLSYYPEEVFPPFTADDPASASETVDRIAGVSMRDAFRRAVAVVKEWQP